MFVNSLGRFLRDERGSYTIWSVIWFMLYVALGGLALDATDGYRHQTFLQATADSAALAGVMSLHDGNAVPMALAYAENNMDPNVHGTVLTAEDVKLGRWDVDTEVFIENGSPVNAVYVTTRRMEQNGNPLNWNFLRILSLFGADPWWNVQAEAVAMEGNDKCLNDGLVAGNQLLFNPHTNFKKFICLIGVEGMDVASQGNAIPTFESTVYAGVGCAPEDNCVGPGSNPWNNTDFLNAFNYEPGNYYDKTEPTNAEKVGTYIETMLAWADPNRPDPVGSDGEPISGGFLDFVDQMKGTGTDYSGWGYLVNTGTVDEPNYLSKPEYGAYTAEQFSALSDEEMVPHKVYEITSCTNGNTFDLPAKTYDRVGIVTGCQMNFPSGSYNLRNSLLMSTHVSNTTNGYGDPAFKAINNVDISFGLENDCNNGVEIYSMGNVNMASGIEASGSRILADGNVKFAAKANAENGINIEATGNINPASGSNSQSNWGLCSGVPNKQGPQALFYALVR